MRGRKAVARMASPDPVYGNRKVEKLINQVMVSGKKSIARRHIYQALEVVKEKAGKDPIQVLETALAQIMPKMDVRSRRIGGAAYQVPAPVKGHKGFSLAVRWLVAEARKRPNKQYRVFSQKLAAEILDAMKGEGGAVQKKLMVHKQAEANKAFSHFRW